MNGDTPKESDIHGSVPPKTEKKVNTLMGVLAYLGILVVIPYAAAKEDPFVRFHVKQGIVLFIAEIIVWIISWTVWLGGLIDVLDLVLLIFAIIGIVNVLKGKEEKLPFIGDLAHYFDNI